MGRIKKGILGGFSGKVGSVVGASWRGIDYIRSLPKISTKPPTPAQQGQRWKLSLFRGFLLVIPELVEKLYQNYSEYTAMNAAQSYNMKEATTGNSPEFEIHFPNFLYSRGVLQGAGGVKAVSLEPASVNFSWSNDFFAPLCAASDEVVIIVYSPVAKKLAFLENAGTRQDQGAKIIVPASFSGSTVHCYLSLYSADKNLASTNQYLGEIPVL